MELSREDVLHLAQLARLELTPEEVEQYRRELTKVLAYVAQLQELPPQAGEAVRGGAVLRPDSVDTYPDPARLVAAAPEHEGSYVVVPQVFDEAR